MITLNEYFNYENTYKLNAEEVYDLIDIETILEAEIMLNEEGLSNDNIYFKLLSQVQHFEKEFEKNRDVISYLYFIIGYYVGLFLHPMTGDEIAINYLKRAISIEKNETNINKYKETIDMINEVL